MKTMTPAKRGVIGMAIALGIYNLIINHDFRNTAIFLRTLEIFAICVPIVVIGLLPTVFVQLFSISVKKPKPYYIQSSANKLAFLGGIESLAGAIIGGVLGNIISSGNIKVIVVLAVWGALVPINMYAIYTKVFYKRTIEYGTPEWKEKRDEKLSLQK
jgi:hypothetical protein